MFLRYQNVHRLELRTSFKFWVAHLPVKKEIGMRFNSVPIFLILDIMYQIKSHSYFSFKLCFNCDQIFVIIVE